MPEALYECVHAAVDSKQHPFFHRVDVDCHEMQALAGTEPKKTAVKHPKAKENGKHDNGPSDENQRCEAFIIEQHGWNHGGKRVGAFAYVRNHMFNMTGRDQSVHKTIDLAP